ncbi:MAG: foldase protein PrsA [Roseibacillus sp.]
MKPDTGALVRAIVYSVALVYLFVDLFVLKGPLYRSVKDANPRSEKVIAEETARGVAARVRYQPILLTQIDRAVEKRLWSRGKSATGLEGEQLKQERMAALNEMFQKHLLRIKVRFNAAEFQVSDEEVAAAVKTFKKRFANEQLLKGAIVNQGWDGEEELVARIRAKLEQEAYLRKYVAVEVTEEELQAYYQEHRARFALPERIRARHIFFAALEHPGGAALALAQSVRDALREGRDFNELSAEYSEDPATKEKGGELGWMSRGRMPEGLGEQVFQMQPGATEVLESDVGAHVFEVQERKPARERSFEEVKDELEEALSNQRREEGTQQYLRILHHRDAKELEIFTEVLERPWSLTDS